MIKPLDLLDYADQINLYDRYEPSPITNRNREELVDIILEELQEGNDLEYKDKRRLLHGRLNGLPPNSLSKGAISLLDQLLQLELEDKQIASSDQLLKLDGIICGKTKVVLWQGDISTLKVDAIVNAANNQLLGCWQPLHACIDNVIHSAAGVQLRDDCDLIMEKQGFAEPTGVAKITRAYNLPSNYVLHTVGPIVRDGVSKQHMAQLANVYRSCLDLSKQIGSIKSIAFCGVSTGVFGYPVEDAAKIAISTVINWLNNNSSEIDLVVFNQYSDRDRSIYECLINEIVDNDN